MFCYNFWIGDDVCNLMGLKMKIIKLKVDRYLLKINSFF